MGQLIRLATCLVILTVFAGCTEIQFLSQASKSVAVSPAEPPGNPNQPDLGRRYKVGSAYQIKGVWYYPKEDYGYVEEGIASWYGPGFHGRRTANGAIFDEMKVSAAHKTLPLPSMVRVTNLENGRSIKVVVNDRGPYAHSRVIDLSRRAAQLLGFEVKGTTLVRVELLESESRQLAASFSGGPAFNSGPTVIADAGPEPPPPQSAPTAEVAGEELAPPPGVSATVAEAEAPITPEVPAERPDTSAEVEIASEDVTVVPVAPDPNVFIQAGAFGQFANASRAQTRLSYLGPVVVEEITRSATPLFRVRLGPLKDDERLESLLVAVIAEGFTDAQIIVQKP